VNAFLIIVTDSLKAGQRDEVKASWYRAQACPDRGDSWADRNAHFGTAITSELERRGIIAELASSNRVTRWAYSQTEGVGRLTWLRADEMVPLAPTWRDLIQPFSEM
jgi:hypothetical protein